MRSVCWIHLSDLHIDDKHRDVQRDTVLDALWSDIKERTHRIHPDLKKINFAVVTGDIAKHGKESEYKIAKEVFLDPLCQKINTPPERLFLVPGNHDINRTIANLNKPKWRKALAHLDNSEKVTKCLETKRERSLFFARLRAYRSFLKTCFPHLTLCNEGLFYGTSFRVNRVPTGLIGLNSAWTSYGGKNEYGKLILGERQAIGSLEFIENTNLRIAIVHHPFDWFVPIDDREYSESRIRQGCNFLLHGHLHRPDAKAEVTPSGSLVTIPAGSIYLKRQFPNSYNYVTLDIEAGKGTVYFRRYVDRNLGWQKDTDVSGDKNNGAWSFYFSPDVFPLHLIDRPVTKAPTNLPQRPTFIGRKADLRRVTSALQKNQSIVCIEGMPGIGKSDLAIAAGRELIQCGSFDFVAWLKDHGATLTLNEVLDVLSFLLNVSHASKLPLNTKRLFIQDLLRSNRCLVIIDNFETIADIEIERFAAICPSPSRFLFTSREKRPSDSCLLHLAPLSINDALKLLRSWKKEPSDSGPSLTEAILKEMANATGRNPLAMKWAMAQVSHAGLPIQSVLTYLNKAKGDLFTFLFSRAWQFMSPSAKLLSQTVTVLPSPARLEVLENISGLGRSNAEEAIRELSTLCLLDSQSGVLDTTQRYTMHPLTTTFVNNQLHRTPDVFNIIMNNATQYWLTISKEYGGMKWDWKGYEQLALEIDNIFSAIHWCKEQRRWKDIKSFREYLSNGLSIRGLWQRRIELAEMALSASLATNDKLVEAWCLVYDLAYINLKTGDISSAKKRVEKGLPIFKKYKDRLGLAASYHHLGKIEEMSKNYKKARSLYRKSLNAYKGDQDYELFLLSELATVDYLEKNFSEAKLKFQKALDAAAGKSGKTEIVVSRCLGYLGELDQNGGNSRSAKEKYQKAIDVARRIGRADEIALNNLRLARLYHSQADDESAYSAAYDALNMYRQMYDTEGQNEAEKLIAILQHN